MSTVDNTVGAVRPIDITSSMQDAYLDYAMSVIVARALPDVRDGLKPVHRRILYAMYHDLGLVHTRPHKKSARIVGEVLGKYHPHGDTAVYDAMVRMAQEFSLRYPLVDGQGNFGSVDGDNAAAMRYTEARLDEISDLMLSDLDKNTVDWHDNFDNSLREPDILPAALPNLLINGSSGIAVGMATNIPPHNLGEVVDALVFMIDNYANVDDITAEQLLRFVQAPDFPTGGILYRYREDKKSGEETDVIAQGYSVGKARLILQAKAHFEEMSRNRSRIVITELPYQTNKVALLERIATLVRDGKIEGITDLRDESDRTGMRVVIELTRNVEPKDVLADLFKYTPLQQTFGMQMLALVDGEPRTLSLKRMLYLFIQHREEIIRRRSEFDLARARARAHIVEGLLRALDILDEVIATIRRSQRVETARTNLMKNFGFTQIQAQAILDMQLRRLAALERRKLQDEYKELLARIKYLEDLLAHPEKVLGVIKEDLIALREKYGDARRTQIVDRTKGTLTTTDLLPDQNVWVSVSASGELQRQDQSRLSATVLRQIGKGCEIALMAANTRDFLYLFGHDGRSRRLSVHEIPQNGNPKHLAELTEYSRRERVDAALILPRTEARIGEGYLCLVTKKGMVKRVALSDFSASAASDPIVMGVDSGDQLEYAFLTAGDQDLILVSDAGKSIRFNESTVRSMGLAAGGVGGMKLKKGESIVHAGVVKPDGDLLTVTKQGFAKRSSLTEYSVQGRNGGGIVTHKITSRTGPVVAALVLDVADVEEPVIFSASAGVVKLTKISDIPTMGRSVQGKQVVKLAKSGAIVAVQKATEPPHISSPENGVAPSPSDKGGNGVVSSNGAGRTKGRSRSTATTSRRGSSRTATNTRTTRNGAKKNGKPTASAATASKSKAASQSRRTAKNPQPASRSTDSKGTRSAAASGAASSRSKSKSTTAKPSTAATKSSAKAAPASKSKTKTTDRSGTAKKGKRVAAGSSRKSATSTSKQRASTTTKGQPTSRSKAENASSPKASPKGASAKAKVPASKSDQGKKQRAKTTRAKAPSKVRAATSVKKGQTGENKKK